MKIALVTETYPPEVNGVAMTLSRLVGGLRARGHEVEVVRPRQKREVGDAAKTAGPATLATTTASTEASGSSEMPASSRSAGATERSKSSTSTAPAPRDLLVPGMAIPFYDTLRMGLPVSGRLGRHWRTQRPDVVHIATEGPLGWAALRAARRLGLPVTSSFHTNFHHYSGHYGVALGRDLALRYLRWFHNSTACTLVPTDEMRAQLSSEGLHRLGVLSRGVDTRLFTPERRSDHLRASWGAAPTDPVAIYVGRIAAEKNLGLAMQAFVAMRARLPTLRVVLVGDGPERAGLARQYPDFVWAGTRRGEELAAHYASADVFIFPSVTETFGNVVTEAMASGLVTLSYDYAAGRQHVRDGKNGFVAPFGNPAAFVERARAVAGLVADWPALRAAARATAQTITWDVIFDRFETELRAAAAGRAGESIRGEG